MGKNDTDRSGADNDFDKLAQRLLTARVTQKSILIGTINALGGPEVFCENMAKSYAATKPGSAARVRYDTSFLSGLATLKDDDAIPIDDFEELAAAAKQILMDHEGLMQGQDKELTDAIADETQG